LSTGAPIKSKKPCISPKTEAYAVLQLKGNHGRWQKQFQVADHPDYKGRIQRILGRKKEGEDDGPIEKHWIMDQPATAKAKRPTAKAKTAHTKAKTAPTKAKVKENDPKAAEEEAQQNGKPVATTTRTSRRKAPKETEEGDDENPQEEEKAAEEEEQQAENEEENEEASDSESEEDIAAASLSGEIDEVSGHCFMSHWGCFVALLWPICCPIGIDSLSNCPF